MAPKVDVELRYRKPGTQPPVFVAGSYSDPPWKPAEMAVTRAADGGLLFSKTVALEPGARVQYKFRLGRGNWWALDDDAPTVTDRAGNRNNLIVVPSEPAASTSSAPPIPARPAPEPTDDSGELSPNMDDDELDRLELECGPPFSYELPLSDGGIPTLPYGNISPPPRPAVVYSTNHLSVSKQAAAEPPHVLLGSIAEDEELDSGEDRNEEVPVAGAVDGAAGRGHSGIKVRDWAVQPRGSKQSDGPQLSSSPSGSRADDAPVRTGENADATVQTLCIADTSRPSSAVDVTGEVSSSLRLDGGNGTRDPQADTATTTSTSRDSNSRGSDVLKQRLTSSLASDRADTPLSTRSTTGVGEPRKGGFLRALLRVLFVDWIGGFVSKLCGTRRNA